MKNKYHDLVNFSKNQNVPRHRWFDIKEGYSLNLVSEVISDLKIKNKKSIIFDPFSGSGTTAVVAKKLQRNFIGIEKDKDYVKLSKERLKNTKVLKEEVVTIAKSRKELPKVPFGELVEQGIIPPGAVLSLIHI